jgi:hypothetical protein
MANPQPARISFNNENLNPDKARFTDYRLSTDNIFSLNYDLTYGV